MDVALRLLYIPECPFTSYRVRYVLEIHSLYEKNTLIK